MISLSLTINVYLDLTSRRVYSNDGSALDDSKPARSQKISKTSIKFMNVNYHTIAVRELARSQEINTADIHCSRLETTTIRFTPRKEGPVLGIPSTAHQAPKGTSKYQ